VDADATAAKAEILQLQQVMQEKTAEVTEVSSPYLRAPPILSSPFQVKAEKEKSEQQIQEMQKQLQEMQDDQACMRDFDCMPLYIVCTLVRRAPPLAVA